MEEHKINDHMPEDPFQDNVAGDEDVDDEFPCRPCSRLSFNQEGHSSDEDTEDTSDSEESDSDFVARLLQRSRILEPPESKNSDRSPPRRSPLTRQHSFRLGTESSNSSLTPIDTLPESPDDPFCESPCCPSEFDEFHKPPAECEEDWSIKPKFSCLPSPLSPHHDKGTYSYRYTPPRHCYGHHGLSRHALQHSKWFWAVREELWLERQAESDPFEDPVLPYERWSGPPASSPFIEPESPSIPSFSPPPSHPVPPMTIHPRRGDITSLRDPYSTHIDRYFVGMPLWTMSKTLWMFDMHMATARGPSNCKPVIDPPTPLPGDATPVDEEDSRSCDSMQRSDSAGFSDDSDSTLVESDSEGETPVDDNIPIEGTSNMEQQASEEVTQKPGPTTPEEKARIDTSITSPRPGPSSPVKSPNHIIFAGWPPNWYRRWEILLHLCFKNTVCTPNPANIPPPVPSERPVVGKLAKRKPRFYVGDEEEEEEAWSDIPLKRDEDLQEGPRSSEKVLFVVNRVANEEETD